MFDWFWDLQKRHEDPKLSLEVLSRLADYSNKVKDVSECFLPVSLAVVEFTCLKFAGQQRKIQEIFRRIFMLENAIRGLPCENCTWASSKDFIFV